MSAQFPYDGLEIVRDDKIIYGTFHHPHKVLSTCPVAGGINERLMHLYNHQSCEPASHFKVTQHILELSDYEYRNAIASTYNLDGSACATLITAANMRCAAFETETFEDVVVFAVITAGVKTNAGRAGDEATVVEREGSFDEVKHPVKPGTINCMLFINHELSSGAMVQAVTTATEAKCAALQELSIPSMYSPTLATGTGTDQIGIATKKSNMLHLTGAGKHTKLGEMIGKVVLRGVKQALVYQNSITHKTQCSLVALLKRFGVSQEVIIDSVTCHLENQSQLFTDNYLSIDNDPVIVSTIMSITHLWDQLTWNVLPASCVPEIFCTYLAQLSCAVSGVYTRFDTYRVQLINDESLLALKTNLAPHHFLALIGKSIAIGFLDKWKK